jgi:hypothetical protein
MTRSRLVEIQSRGRMFCDLWVVSYFMEITRNQAVHLYRSGRLPKVHCPDGSEYRPSAQRLVVVSDFAAMVAEERRAEFDLWRMGIFDVSPFGSLSASPPRPGSLATGLVNAAVLVTDRHRHTAVISDP